MRFLLAATCAVTILASTAVAQPPRGRGGFGGGFGGPPGGAGIGLLAMPEVQKELSINDGQKEKITGMMTKLREEMQAQGGGFQGLQDLSQEERQKRMEEFRKRAEETQKKVHAQLTEILDAKQMERFEQLRLQQEGPMAITRADVADKLKLTPEQREQVSKLQSESRRGFGGGAGAEQDRAAAFQRMQEAREKLTTGLLAVLTADQKADLEKMHGAKFDFPERRFGGPGGPGGGQGGGQRRRPAAKE